MANFSNISISTITDIPALVRLINSAYRGEASRKGWTTEADLLKGELRIDETSLAELFQKPGAVILKYSDTAEAIKGCVYLEKQEKKMYLGMLTVSPDAQTKGIGKKLLTASEEYAKKKNCSSVVMNVISVRDELILWYERHGYQKNGERKPFPADTKFGIPTQPLEFAVLEKIFS